jgi:tetratricopeptide (TPR) repeat protein
MSQPRIFMSYSHQDAAFTQRLVGDLKQAGAEVWYDVIGIDQGDFMQRIDDALRHCDWLVLVLSEAALASPYVQMEVNAGLHRVRQGQMRAVIPMMAAPFPAESMPALWDVLQRYDATADYPAALAGLLRALGLASPADGSFASAAPAALPAAPHDMPTQDQIAHAKALAAERKFPVAAYELERLVRVVPQNTEAWTLLGDMYLPTLQWPQAVAAYDRALALDPSLVAAWKGKARALHAMRRGGEARAAERRAKELEGGPRRGWFGRGRR